jgi:hypothetical protein
VPDRHNPHPGESEGGGLEWLHGQLGDEAESAEPSVVEPPVVEPVETQAARTLADLEPAPWWTTAVQAPLVPTTAETAQLLPGQLPDPDVPEAGVSTSSTIGASSTTGAGPTTGRGSGSGRTTRTLLWVAGALLAIIVLVGLFFLGQRLGSGSTPVAAPTPTPTATPTPTPTPAPTGTQPAGVHQWDALGGGECVQPYTSPWDEEFTVVDCAAPHTAQLVYRGTFPGDETTAFPGETALSSQINLLCSAPGVIDLAAARAYPDVQLQGSYPVTDEQWTSGQRSYFCFVSRSSGEPLTTSVAGPGPAPAG